MKTKWTNKIILSLIAFLFVASRGYAIEAPDFSIGMPKYRGGGCPDGSISATISPDARAISIIFDDYSVEAGVDSNVRVAQKACKIQIPIHIPEGYSISIKDVDYRGYVYLPSKKYRAVIMADYFFVGSKGPRYVRKIMGPTDHDFFLAKKMKAPRRTWSPCNMKKAYLRVDSRLKVKAPRRADDNGIVSMDSADIDAGLVYNLKWKKCIN